MMARIVIVPENHMGKSPTAAAAAERSRNWVAGELSVHEEASWSRLLGRW